MTRPRKLPTKISAADLKARRVLVEHGAALERANNEIQIEMVKLAGRWEQFRTTIEPRYGMTSDDRVDDNGTILRKEPDAN